MNVPFVTGDADLDAKFVKEAKEAGFVNLLRDTEQLAVCEQLSTMQCQSKGVEKLVEFMKKFEEENLK